MPVQVLFQQAWEGGGGVTIFLAYRIIQIIILKSCPESSKACPYFFTVKQINKIKRTRNFCTFRANAVRKDKTVVEITISSLLYVQSGH